MATWAILRTWLLSNRAETTPSVATWTPMMLPALAPLEVTEFTGEADASWVSCQRSTVRELAAMPRPGAQAGDAPPDAARFTTAAEGAAGATVAGPNRVEVLRL